MDIDDVMFETKGVNPFVEVIMAGKKKVDTPTEIKDGVVKYGVGIDIGTGFLCGAGFDDKGEVKFSPLRDAFYTIDKQFFNQNMFNKNSMKYVEKGDQVYVIGEDALTLAKIRNGAAKRPLALGVINPQERDAAPILREMFRYCIQPHKKKEGDICVFSIPGPKIDDIGYNVDYHSMSMESLINSFGMKPVPLNEGFAVIVSEMEDASDVTGIGISFGAGLVNVAFAYKSMKVFEFSIDKSGDFIDKEASKACGMGESMISHIKEKNLDLLTDEFSASPEIRSLIFTYKYVIRNTIREIIKAFSGAKNVNVIDPVPVIISGGTSLPNGFVELFEKELRGQKLPFEVTEVIPAKMRLAAVARGCLLWASYLESTRNEEQG